MRTLVRFPWPIRMLCAAALCTGGCQPNSDGETAQVQATLTAPAARRSTTWAGSGGNNGSAATITSKGRPGQLVVKFKTSGPQGLTQDAQTWLRQGRSFASATADGSGSLDVVLRRHQVRDARPLVRDRAGLDTAAATSRLQTRLSKLTAARGLKRAPAAADLVNVYRLEVAAGANVVAAAAELASDPHVAYAQPNYEMHATYTPDDPFLASTGSWGQNEADLWGLKKLATEQAWNTTRGAGIVVAVVDSGVDFSHPDLVANAWVNTDEIAGNGIDDDHNGYVDDLGGWNTAADNNDPTDRAGHGTHVAGTIAAQDNNGLGVVGVAPDAQIMAVKGLDDNGSGSSFDLAEALLYAGTNGARVVNNSWGCRNGCPSNPVVEDAVSALHASGVTVLFAAGNDQKDVKIYSPQNRPEPIVVSAATPLDALASFSNFGLVDVAAPGAGTPGQNNVVAPDQGILSLKSTVCNASLCPPQLIVGGIYLRQSGTSMATPHVAGLAALILSQHPNYTPEDVRQVLRRSSRDVGTAGFDAQFGYGFINAAAAVTQPAPLKAYVALGPRIETARPVAVPGSAAGPGFLSYLLEYGAGAEPATFTAIASSSVQIPSGTLGTWAVGSLADGEYTLRLTARTTDGRSYEDRNLVVLDRVSITAPEPLSFNGANAAPIQILGTAAPANMDRFAIRVERLLDGVALTNLNITLTGQGRTPVENGVLAVWNPAGVPADDYRISLDVTAVGGVVQSDSVPVLVDTKIRPGWPVVLDNAGENIPFQDSSVVADLDGDRRDEHIVAYARQVNVFKHDGTQLAGWPQRVNPNGEPVAVLLDAPAVGDVNGDGRPDVVVASFDGKLWVWNSNGTLQAGWPRLIGTLGANHDVTLADVDRDGRLDIVFTDAATGSIDVRRGSGASLPGFPVSAGTGLSAGATAADLDGNGSVEIVASLSNGGPYSLVAYSSTGQLLPGFPVSVGTASSFGAYPVVGDIDDDGDREIVVSAAGFSDAAAGRVAAYHHTGQLVAGWPKVVNAIQMSAPVLADLDGDGSLEVITGTTDGRGALYVWNGAGSLMPGWPVFTPDTVIFTPTPFLSPIVLNVDSDHRSELITVRIQDDFLPEFLIPFGKPIQAFKHNGTPIPDLARPQFGNLPSGVGDLAPAVGDTDGDGKLEMVWLEDRSINTGERFADAWDLDIPATTNVAWRMARADARRSSTAQPVVPIRTLTAADRDRPISIDGLGRFRVTTGPSGIIQISRGWQPATVKWAIGSDALQPTPFAWGGPIQLQPSTQYLLRVATIGGPSDVRISWW
jgi:subtilisin family serine protease